MSAGRWTLEACVAKDGTVPFDRFLGKLSGGKLAALDAALIHVLAVRGMDLARTEWLKPLGGGLFEFRIRHSEQEIVQVLGRPETERAHPPEQVLLRVFVHFHGSKVVLLLGGYDKHKKPKHTYQQKEIEMARKDLADSKHG